MTFKHTNENMSQCGSYCRRLLADKEFRAWLEEKNLVSGLVIALATKNTLIEYRREYFAEKRHGKKDD